MKKEYSEKLSLIIPAFNEEENIQNTAERVLEVIEEIGIGCEIIFVSDGSKDRTYEEIRRAAEKDPRVKGIELSRNFGKEAAIVAGLEKGEGDCFIVMDCDLQHPPETIPEMVRLWREGSEIVEGIKKTRGKQFFLHNLFAGAFYKVLSKVTGFDMMNTSDFKLLDKKVVKLLLSMPEKNRFFRALTFWAGFRRAEVYYRVGRRERGTTKWSFGKLLRYAVSNIISYSSALLNVVTYIGIFGMLIGLILAVQSLVRWLMGNAVEGFTTVNLLIIFMGSCILLGMGVIGTYIGAIYEEVKGRPIYIVAKDLDDEKRGEDGRG